MYKLNVIVLGSIITMLAACSSGEPENGEHVWKEKTDTIDQAKEAERMIMESAEQRRKAMEQQGG